MLNLVELVLGKRLGKYLTFNLNSIGLIGSELLSKL